MTCTKRWTVTYTKHMKQKRKVYQDGVLEQSASGNKVMLYDDSEKLIDSRFFKKGEVVECGRTLTMEAHLVDIGDPEANHKPLTNLNISRTDKKLNEMAGLQGQNENRKSMLQSKRPNKVLNAINCSIRDNKKNTSDGRPPQKHSVAVPRSITVSTKTEFGSSGAPQTRPNTTHTPLKEWNVLYTTQITQKAKRYHDGILRLALCGSHNNQIFLLDEDGAVLSSKFLRSAENVEKGNKIGLSNYLVEVCEPLTSLEEGLHQVPSVQVACSSCSNDSKFTTNTENLSGMMLPTEDLQKGHSEQVIGSSGSNIGKSTSCGRLLNDEPLRDACQILSILQKPLPKENVDQRKLPVDQAHSSPSSDCTLLDVQSHTKELSVPGMNFLRETVGDKHDYDSAGGAAQTSTSGSPFVDFEASQEVHTSSIIIAADIDSEEKLPSDGCSSTCNQLSGQVAPETSATITVMESTEKSYAGMTVSTAGSRVSDANACTSFRMSQGNVSDNSSADNDRSPGPPGTSGTGILGVYSVKYESTDQICTENKADGRLGRVPLLDESESLNATTKNSECQCSTSMCLDVDEAPTFDLGL
ncbi:uncharacterized protein LOC103721443 isoform X1 [Phoenix dactylifera]|uniref:Uncharacterized protein LOC103721443 isoform X1 n=1 Tax=Phoenix dactylifera TaxID=42345 RepID=A0A8B7MWW1_PHODC|nr:uncharacterized protein LOC103721443 isoform X1 [Phoenix dactylifera]